MSNIDNIRIKGLDANRRPSLKNKKYIDVFYELRILIYYFQKVRLTQKLIQKIVYM